MSANKNPNREIIFSFPFREMREAIDLGKKLQNTAKENEKKAALLAKRRDNWRARALAAEAELGRLQTKRAALEESFNKAEAAAQAATEKAGFWDDLMEDIGAVEGTIEHRIGFTKYRLDFGMELLSAEDYLKYFHRLEPLKDRLNNVFVPGLKAF